MPFRLLFIHPRTEKCVKDLTAQRKTLQNLSWHLPLLSWGYFPYLEGFPSRDLPFGIVGNLTLRRTHQTVTSFTYTISPTFLPKIISTPPEAFLFVFGISIYRCSFLEIPRLAQSSLFEMEQPSAPLTPTYTTAEIGCAYTLLLPSREAQIFDQPMANDPENLVDNALDDDKVRQTTLDGWMKGLQKKRTAEESDTGLKIPQGSESPPSTRKSTSGCHHRLDLDGSCNKYDVVNTVEPPIGTFTLPKLCVKKRKTTTLASGVLTRPASKPPPSRRSRPHPRSDFSCASPRTTASSESPRLSATAVREVLARPPSINPTEGCGWGHMLMDKEDRLEKRRKEKEEGEARRRGNAERRTE